jgi:hypothetical protein
MARFVYTQKSTDLTEDNLHLGRQVEHSVVIYFKTLIATKITSIVSECPCPVTFRTKYLLGTKNFKMSMSATTQCDTWTGQAVVVYQSTPFTEKRGTLTHVHLECKHPRTLNSHTKHLQHKSLLGPVMHCSSSKYFKNTRSPTRHSLTVGGSYTEETRCMKSVSWNWKRWFNRQYHCLKHRVTYRVTWND